MLRDTHFYLILFSFIIFISFLYFYLIFIIVMIASFASLMVELEKCGSSLADLHNARGFETKYFQVVFTL